MFSISYLEVLFDGSKINTVRRRTDMKHVTAFNAYKYPPTYSKHNRSTKKLNLNYL